MGDIRYRYQQSTPDRGMTLRTLSVILLRCFGTITTHITMNVRGEEGATPRLVINATVPHRTPVLSMSLYEYIPDDRYQRLRL
ncbi:uncharacterized protein LOC143146178 isoform X3 [Ptiloglossa arizonensis]|uniref:uncharacterized protein LOC143146178 isoform X3 n=1 Tax=Ptiloglossa arizonensis TaxID=3350558 RepID=UPI003F9F104B